MSERPWLLVEILLDDETHAAPRTSNHSYCGHRVSFPVGGDAQPSCVPCKNWTYNLAQDAQRGS